MKKININPDELDHVIREFTFKDMPGDMALFFLTQDLDYNDLFKYSIIDNNDFYKKTFSYILSFILDRANTGRFNEIIWDFTSKIYWTTYRKDNVYPVEDYLTSVLFANMFNYFVKNNMENLVLLSLDALFINKNVDSRAIVELIIDNKELHTRPIITHLMRSDLLTATDILALILLEYYNSKDPDTLINLMDEYALTKDYYLDLLDALKENYTVIVNDTSDSRRSVYINPRYKTKYTNALDLVRVAVASTINNDADMEILMFLDQAINIHQVNHDVKRAHLYTYIKNWLMSENRKEERLASLLWYGFEDCSLDIEDRDFRIIAQDILVNQYLREDRFLSPYELFIRVYNLNRFNFLQRDMKYTIREELIRKLNVHGYPVVLGLRDDVKWLINF